MATKETLRECRAEFGIPDNAAFFNMELTCLLRSFGNCGLDKYPEVTGDPDGERASGECRCKCGLFYLQHPLDWREISYDGQAYLHVLCDGRRVKL